jgi:hypothetical protein
MDFREFFLRNCPKSPNRLRTEASEVDEKGSKKPYLPALGAKNGSSRGYSRPFSDGFSRHFVNKS